ISLQRRARSRAAAASPKWTPGDEIDVTAAWMPCRSIRPSASSTLQLGNGIPPPPVMPIRASAETYSPGRMWWWTSTRCAAVTIRTSGAARRQRCRHPMTPDAQPVVALHFPGRVVDLAATPSDLDVEAGRRPGVERERAIVRVHAERVRDLDAGSETSV